VITQLAYYTGSRISEVCALTAEDIRAGKIVIHQTKTDRTKEVVVVPPLKEAITQAQLPSSGVLFPPAKWTRATVKQYRIQRHGDGTHHFERVGERPPRKHISPRAVDKALRRACDLLGFEGVSTHTFRRSLATHLYDAGVPLRQIMAITGHASLASFDQLFESGATGGGGCVVKLFVQKPMSSFSPPIWITFPGETDGLPTLENSWGNHCFYRKEKNIAVTVSC
jgi:integrase/recombinase XerD